LTKIAGAVLLAVALAGCGGSDGGPLRGAGSTLVYPMVHAWIPEVRARSGFDTRYSSVGSGAGIQAITTRTVDFGASDAPLTPEQADSCDGCVLVPWALSATALAYNLPGSNGVLRLSGPVLADIYLGKITNWSDQRIASLNPGKKLPAQEIAPIFRSDASGDTYAFTSYLAKISPAWKAKVGAATVVDIPVGAGGRGNAGAAGVLTRTPGAIGYISVAYAVQNRLRIASIENAAGHFVRPDLESIEAAAQAMGRPRADNSIPIVDPPASASSAYPISTFTYAIVRTKSSRAGDLRELLQYAVGPGQQFAERYVFARLPARVVALARKTIATIGS
jgi:phosphate transport system substrate-binding protein